MDFQVVYGIPTLWENDFGFQKNGRVVVETDAVTISGERLLRYHALYAHIYNWSLFLYVGFFVLSFLASLLSPHVLKPWLNMRSYFIIIPVVLNFLGIFIPFRSTLRLKRRQITGISRLGTMLTLLVLSKRRKRVKRCVFLAVDIETARQIEAALRNPAAQAEAFDVSFDAEKERHALDLTESGMVQVDEAAMRFSGRGERRRNRLHHWFIISSVIVLVPLLVVFARTFSPYGYAYLWWSIGLIILTILVLGWLGTVFPRPTTISVPRIALQDVEQDDKSMCLTLRTPAGPAPLYLLLRSEEEAVRLRKELHVPAHG